MPSVVIPAHQEEASIAAAIDSVLQDDLDDLEIVVVANACSDRTASRAAAASDSVTVIETDIAGKCHAMNLGDSAVTSFPRAYMDGDVDLIPGTLGSLMESIGRGLHLTCPKARLEPSGLSTAAKLVLKGQSTNQFYNGEHAPNGSGIFVVSEAGRSRWGAFPEHVINDDGFVGLHFTLEESRVTPDAISNVYPPITFWDMIGPRSRSIRGNWQLEKLYPDLYHRRYRGIGRGNAGSILRNPGRWFPGMFYGASRLLARARALAQLRGNDWNQDRSCHSRSGRESG